MSSSVCDRDTYKDLNRTLKCGKTYCQSLLNGVGDPYSIFNSKCRTHCRKCFRAILKMLRSTTEAITTPPSTTTSLKTTPLSTTTSSADMIVVMEPDSWDKGWIALIVIGSVIIVILIAVAYRFRQHIVEKCRGTRQTNQYNHDLSTTACQSQRYSPVPCTDTVLQISSGHTQQEFTNGEVQRAIASNGVAAPMESNGVAPQIGLNGVAPQIGSNAVPPHIGPDGEAPQIGANSMAPQIGMNSVAPQIGMNGGVTPQIGPNCEVQQIGMNGVAPQIGMNGVAPQIGLNGVSSQTGSNGMAPQTARNGRHLANNAYPQNRAAQVAANPLASADCTTPQVASNGDGTAGVVVQQGPGSRCGDITINISQPASLVQTPPTNPDANSGGSNDEVLPFSVLEEGELTVPQENDNDSTHEIEQV